jgi:glycosyltransferase involved in cell wall biosynthesis
MHRRSVDYCSGVFLMTPSKLFKEIGGFDMRYAPAYYEESDYCAQLQKRGLSVIYDPRIFVRHVEFGSAVRSAAAFSLMHTNREKFLEKNRELLAQKCPPGTPHYRARSIPSGRKRWLFLDDRVALPHMGAGYPRMNQIIHIIAGLERYDITIACTEKLTADWKEIRRDIPLDIEVVDLTDATRRERFLRERLNDFDVVWVSRPANMQHIVDATTPDLLRHKNFVMVYDSEAIFADRALTEAKVFGLKTDKAKTLMQAELLNGSRADILVAVCQSDARRWQEVAKRNVIIVGIKAAVAAGPKNFSERRDMLFVGSLHGLQSPNADSLFWFMKYVMPRINKALPDVATHAVGYVDSGMMAYIGRNTRNFTLIGAVPEIRPFLLEHRLVIAPTRFAAGIPQKVYDAAVTGTPTVCSPLIASQMEWQDGAETLVGSIDDPQNFADQCIKLYTDEALWNGIYDRSLASMQQYTSTYNLEGGVHQVLDAIEQHIEKARQGTSSQCANAL